MEWNIHGQTSRLVTPTEPFVSVLCLSWDYLQNVQRIAAYCSASLSLAVLAPVNVNVNVKRQMYLEPFRYGSPDGYNEQLPRTVVHLLSTCCPLVAHLLSTCCPLVVHLLSTCQSASVSLRPWDAPSLWRASPEPHGIRHSAFDSIWLWLWHTLAMTLPIFVHVRLSWVVSVVSVFSVVCRFLFFCHFTWSPSGHLKWSEFQCVPLSSTEFHQVPPFSARPRDCWVPVGWGDWDLLAPLPNASKLKHVETIYTKLERIRQGLERQEISRFRFYQFRRVWKKLLTALSLWARLSLSEPVQAPGPSVSSLQPRQRTAVERFGIVLRLKKHIHSIHSTHSINSRFKYTQHIHSAFSDTQ